MTNTRVVIVGAGIGGLAAALRLSHAGCDVTVIEAQSKPGGKMRTVASVAGPVDAGPTVLTMRPVFEALFADVGERLADHVDLVPLSTLARHYWDDGTCLDLMADPDASFANIESVFGAASARDYHAFRARAARLFEAFDAPMMQSSAPSQAALTAKVLRSPRLLWDMAPHKTLAGLLKSSFREPRLAQLFGRYATYVGGSPYLAPALLALVSHAEQRGVWAIRGGMHRLALAIEALCKDRRARFHYDTRVQRIELQGGRVGGVATTAGRVPADVILFNGDPRALVQGNLGQAGKQALRPQSVEPRSLSAYVHAFAAVPSGPALSHHTVFFGSDPRAEFDPLSRGQRPADATLYLCAQDRLVETAQAVRSADQPPLPERFEIILNAPPDGGQANETEKDIAQCQTQVFLRLRTFGLSFDPQPGRLALTTPQGFARLFPASQGSLYGRSPHGLTAGLKRPTARTAVAGLYLVGGGAHPGAGVPMATLSARHAAEAILTDLALPSTSPQTATRGGMLTGSAMTGRAPSRS